MARKAKAKRKEKGFLPLNIGIYRLHVVVTWGTNGKEIAEFASKNHCQFAPRFAADFNENAGDACGLCMSFSNDTPDVLVWLADKPTSGATYSTLYHELYHAVDSISKSRNLGEEPEARAYLFEHLLDQCNKHFWLQGKA